MYAKLVVGGTAISAYRAMRDIGRLLVSNTPSTSLLESFSSTSSIVIDDTPAGWTYVGSVNSADRPTIADAGTALPTTNTHFNLAFSAPTLEDENVYKYALLNIVYRNSSSETSSTHFALTGAQSVTDQGVATNEGPRGQWVSTETINEGTNISTRTAAGDTIHLIATPRHITIINEQRGLSALWETSQTDVHTFYGTPPFIQYNHCNSSIVTRHNIIVPTTHTITQDNSIMAAAFNVYNVNTGANSGTYDPTGGMLTNLGHFAQSTITLRQNSINAVGLPRYQVTPVYVHLGALGYPVQFVTGVVPIYWTAPDIGSTGDNIEINGEIYTFFHCGTGFGVAMQTS
jgi:hypothetical protein